jgi:soluble lytic murein transglycosylase-like protein
MSYSISDLQNYANQQAALQGLNPTIFSWMINQESGWNPNAQSSTSSASGIAQFINGTAAQYGVTQSDPYSSLAGAAKYLKNLLSQNNGDYTAALKQYGTLAGASTSTMNSYNNMLSGTGATSSAATGSNTSTGTGTGLLSKVTGLDMDSYLTRGAIAILAIVVIAGAIYTYKG